MRLKMKLSAESSNVIIFFMSLSSIRSIVSIISSGHQIMSNLIMRLVMIWWSDELMETSIWPSSYIKNVPPPFTHWSRPRKRDSTTRLYLFFDTKVTKTWNFVHMAEMVKIVSRGGTHIASWKTRIKWYNHDWKFVRWQKMTCFRVSKRCHETHFFSKIF